MGACREPALDPQVLEERILVHCEQPMLFSSLIYDPAPSSAFAIEEEIKRQVFVLSTLLSLPWARCIGSIQHLKSKFGKDYLLEVKMKEPTQVEPLHAEILKLFPQAARQER